MNAQYENIEVFQVVINSEGDKKMVIEGSKIAESSLRLYFFN